MKQIALGFLQYAHDYDEIMPGQYSGEGAYAPDANYAAWDAPINTGCWRIKILPYIKNAQIYQCPSVPSAPGNSGYLLNGYCSYRALAQFDSPSSVIMIWELTGPQTWSRMYPNNNGAGGLDLGDMRVWVDHVHNGGDNNVFVDGHAKWLGKYMNHDFDERIAN